MTLTFNKRQNLSHRMDLCTRFLELVEKEFSDLENLRIDIQYGAMVYEKEIEKSAAALVDSLDGKRFTMDGTFHQSMFGFGLKGDGRLVKSDGKLYWMKKSFARRLLQTGKGNMICGRRDTGRWQIWHGILPQSAGGDV